MSEQVSQAPKVIAGYELVSKIGAGGMGSVFKARQISMDRFVALKVLPPRIAKEDPAFVDRFIREARTSAQLNHPHIVQGIEVGQDPATGLYFFAMELIEGPTVKQMLQQRFCLPVHETLAIGRAVALALCCARKAGIVHRDIKPDNILVGADGQPKLADLGLAKRADGNDGSVTESGATLGTPFYMSPEQVRGENHAIDTRSDLYALGATLYHIVTGQPPFTGNTSAVIMAARLNQPAPDPRLANAGIGPACAQLILKLMQPDPAKRFQTPEEAVAAIDAAIADSGLVAAGPATGPGGTTTRKAAVGITTGQRAIARARGAGGRKTRAPSGTASNNNVLFAALGGAAVLLLIGGFFLFRSKPQPVRAKAEETQPEADKPATKPESSVPVPSKSATTTTANSEKPKPAVAPQPEPSPVHPAPPKPVTNRVTPAVPWQNEATPVTARNERPEQTEAPPEIEPTRPAIAPSVAQDEPSAPKPAPAAATLDRSALEQVLDAVAEFLAAGNSKDALDTLNASLSFEGLAPFKDELNDAKTVAAWPEALQKAVAEGAELAGKEGVFVFELEDGEKYPVGEGTPSKVTGIKNGDVLIEMATDKVSLTRKVKLAALTQETRYQLSLLAAGGEAKKAAETKARWALLDAVRIGKEPDPSAISAAAAKLDEARKEGAAEATLAAVEPWLERARKRHADALARAAEEKRKAEAAAKAAWFAENPYRKAQVGDWAEYKVFWGRHYRLIKVSAKSDTEVTLTVSQRDKEGPLAKPTEVKIDLNKPFDRFADLLGKVESKTEAEQVTLSVAGKSLKCRMYLLDSKHDSSLFSNDRVWFSDDVPLSGRVKFEVKWDRDRSGAGRITGPYGYHEELHRYGFAGEGLPGGMEAKVPEAGDVKAPDVAELKPGDHPFSRAQVGEWIRYSDPESGQELRYTVISTAAKSIRLRGQTSTEQVSFAPVTIKVSLDESYDPWLHFRKDVKSKLEEEGKETKKAAGKEWACEWKVYKHDLPDGTWEREKIWYCPQAPLFGWIQKRIEFSNGSVNNLTLHEFGRGE